MRRKRTRICSRCKKRKTLSKDNFEFRKDTRKFRNVCRLCVAKRRRLWRRKKMKYPRYAAEQKRKATIRNKAFYRKNVIALRKKAKKYRKDNPEKVKASFKKYYENNYDKIKRKRDQYREENIEEIRRKNRENKKALGKARYYGRRYRKENPEKVKVAYNEWLKKNPDYHKNYVKNRRKNDINFRLADNLRGRLRDALKNNRKNGSAVKLLGCSIDQLKEYLEKQFWPGMTWENYGFYGWHIDHIIPISSFNLTDEIQLKIACHYTNLQPLWAKQNISKGKKYENNKKRTK